MEEKTNWYKNLDKNAYLEQGEIIKSFPIALPPRFDIAKNPKNAVSIKVYDVIILSHSCDLENDKIDICLICPTKELNQYLSNYSGDDLNKQAEAIRRGFVYYCYMLKKIYNSSDHYIVEFSRIFNANKRLLETYAKNQEERIALTSPYKEHLSQAFARFFMRVGLPSDIEKFYDGNPLKEDITYSE